MVLSTYAALLLYLLTWMSKASADYFIPFNMPDGQCHCPMYKTHNQELSQIRFHTNALVGRPASANISHLKRLFRELTDAPQSATIVQTVAASPPSEPRVRGVAVRAPPPLPAFGPPV